MDQIPRHPCLVYEGPPSRHLVALAAVIRQKLHENHRCLYLDSHPMVAGMRSYLAAAGLDVAEESLRGSLVLSSDRDYLIDDRRFDLEGMMQSLQDALKEAFANAQCEAPEVDSLIDPILEPQGLA